MTPLQQAAQSVVDFWESPEFIGPSIEQRNRTLKEALDAELAQSVEPVAWITTHEYPLLCFTKAESETFCNSGDEEHSIPLYLHQTPPKANTNWLIRKEPNTKDNYYVAEGNPPTKVLEIYGITDQGEAMTDQAKPISERADLITTLLELLSGPAALTTREATAIKNAADMLDADAQQAKQVPMTDEQIEAACRFIEPSFDGPIAYDLQIARAVEAHHGIGGEA